VARLLFKRPKGSARARATREAEEMRDDAECTRTTVDPPTQPSSQASLPPALSSSAADAGVPAGAEALVRALRSARIVRWTFRNTTQAHDVVAAAPTAQRARARAATAGGGGGGGGDSSETAF